MKYIALVITGLILFGSCKTSKNGTRPVSANEQDRNEYINMQAVEAETVETVNQQEKHRNTIWRFIVSFISIGEGTDAGAKAKFDDYLNQWNQNKKVKANYVAVAWGREGEVDFCFSLQGMDEETASEFITGMKDRLHDSKLIRYSENEKCVHIR